MRTLRPFMDADIDEVLAIWLAASIEAHHFIDRGFWENHLDAMRKEYLPASEVWVVEIEGAVKGFCAMHENELAALFVAPGAQRDGIGGELMELAQSQRAQLHLTVYAQNPGAVSFYERHGFTRVGAQTDEATGAEEILMEWRRPAPH